MFDWNVLLKKTSAIEYRNRKYQILAEQMSSSYRLDLLEDETPVFLENTGNESFKKRVNIETEIQDQILEWGQSILKSQLSICNKCKQEKLLWDLEDYDLVKPEFNGLNRICKSCRDSIYKEIMSSIEVQRQKDKAEFRRQLESNPPIIVGGFTHRIDAYKYLRSIKEDSIENIGNSSPAPILVLRSRRKSVILFTWPNYSPTENDRSLRMISNLSATSS